MFCHADIYQHPKMILKIIPKIRPFYADYLDRVKNIVFLFRILRNVENIDTFARSKINC